MLRVAQVSDPISELPPSWLGFVHVPAEVLYAASQTAQFTMCDARKDGKFLQLADPSCAYSGRSMEYHHGYLGNFNTDENKVSTECVSVGAMRQRQGEALLSLAVILCFLVPCCCCCCCCCLGKCVAVRAVIGSIRRPFVYSTLDS